MAAHLAYLTCVLFFSTAIPDLIILNAIYFFLHFWMDKMLATRTCKLPPKYDISLNDRANNILGFSILMHIFASIWIFSTLELFPNSISVYDSVTRVKYYYVKPMSFVNRILDPRVSSYLVLFIGTLCTFYMVEPLAIETAKACCFRKPRRG